MVALSGREHKTIILLSAGQNHLYYIYSKVTLRLTLRERKEVSLDYLAGEGNKASFDKQTIKLINDIEELEPSLKEKLVFWPMPLSGILKRVKLIRNNNKRLAQLRTRRLYLSFNKR
ncbi:hypothetical protein D3C86_1836010 [compost metagenome]